MQCYEQMIVSKRKGREAWAGSVGFKASLDTGNDGFEVGHDVAHGWSLRRVLVPHPLHEVDGLGTPDLAQPGYRRPAQLLADGVIDVVLVVTFPGVFLSVSLGYTS